ncbi:MAG: hypothetical protein HC819_21890 [Cyclobacteriaceae bacterium]|nr:hypothetical protein [Cyclobacteriaceae bacterium]
MKKLAIPFILGAFALLVSACDKVEDLADIDFNTTISKTMSVAVVSTDEMSSSVLLDATSDAEIDKYKSKIKNYEITELTFAIENYSSPLADDNYFDGVVGFGKMTSAAPDKTCAVDPLNVKHVSGTGSFPLGTCDAIADEVANLLKQENAVKVYLNGTFTKEPCTFDLVVTAKVKVTANPL